MKKTTITTRIKYVLFAACVFATGSAYTAQNTYAASLNSIEQAQAKALEKVPGATVTGIDEDYDNGVLTYEVELVKGNKHHDITYRASDAKTLDYSWEKLYVAPSTKNPISQNKCRNLAMQKVKNADIQSIALKFDDGYQYYKVKMTNSTKLYELDFYAATGALISYDWELIANTGNNVSAGNGYITMSKAKQTAQSKAPGARIIKAEFDWDDGRAVYEIELIKGRLEYDCKIDAQTGSILEWDTDYDD